MIDFIYTARDKKGVLRKGEITADNELTASKLLIDKKFVPISIKEKKKSSISIITEKLYDFIPISLKEKVVFSRQLATLVNAGLPISECFESLIESVASKRFQKIISQILQDINSGETLSLAMSKHPSVFDPVYINLVKSGEFSGNLDSSLEKLANQKEKEMVIFSKIKGAMIYPIIVSLICFGVVIMLINTIVPQVVNFYRELEEPIPPMTQMLLNISDFISTKGYLVVLMIPFVFLGFKIILKSKAGKAVMDRAILKIPLIGGIVRKSYMSRFAGILGTLVSSGISLNESLEIVKLALNNEVIEREIEKFVRDVEAGSSLGSSVKDSREFIPLVGQMIMIGEKTGEIDDMLFKVSSYYEKEIDEKVKNITSIIEPIMIVILGGLIFFILGSVLFPMYSLINELTF